MGFSEGTGIRFGDFFERTENSLDTYDFPDNLPRRRYSCMVGWGGSAPPDHPGERSEYKFWQLGNTRNMFTTYYKRFRVFWRHFENFENITIFAARCRPHLANPPYRSHPHGGLGGLRPPRPTRRAFRTEFRRLKNTPTMFISYYIHFETFQTFRKNSTFSPLDTLPYPPALLAHHSSVVGWGGSAPPDPFEERSESSFDDLETHSHCVYYIPYSFWVHLGTF